VAQATSLAGSHFSHTSVIRWHDAAQVKGDVRLIKSKQFATDFSLRFPRVARIRKDKKPQDTMTQQELLEEVDRRRASGARDLARCVASACLQGPLYAMLFLRWSAGALSTSWYGGCSRTVVPADFHSLSRLRALMFGRTAIT